MKNKRNLFEDSLSNFYSEKQLTTIQRTRIGIAGAGGLGSNIAIGMVRSGFRLFEILDFDNVESSNLNRQNYFLYDIGKPKVSALKHILLAINPNLDIITHQKKLTIENVSEYFQSVDILFEAFDQVEYKKLLLESYGNSEVPIIMGSGLAGYKNTEMKIRTVNPRLYIVGDGRSGIGDQNPPLAPRVMACAALMASAALELILSTQ